MFSGSTPISYVTCRGMGGQPPEVGSDQISATARAADAEKCQNLVDDATKAVAEVNRLGDLLNEKMPDFAPSFYEVRKALEDCQTIAQWIKQENGGGQAPAAEGGEAGTVVAGGPASSAAP